MENKTNYIYMAGPLFSYAERVNNEQLSQELKKILPQNTIIILPQESGDKYIPDLEAVYNDCLFHIKNSDIIIANLDGSDADSGTAVEVGFALALGKTIIGYRTDFRNLEADGTSVMLRYACKHIVYEKSFQTNTKQIAQKLSEYILQNSK